MNCDPVKGVEDETHGHVGGGVVDVAEQIHGLSAPLGPELSV